MGYEMKNNQSMPSPVGGPLLAGAFLVIERVESSKRHRVATFDVELHWSYNDYFVLKAEPIKIYRLQATDADYLTYFNPAANSKLWDQCYAYLLAKPPAGFTMSQWQKDNRDEL